MRLGGNHHVMKASLFEMTHVVDGRSAELLGKREVGAAFQFLVERAGVHAHANGNAGLARRLDHGVGGVPSPDVAGVDAQLGGSATRRLDGNLRVEMHVGHHGKRALRAHFRERVQA